MDSVDIRKEYLKWLCSLVNAGPERHLLWYKLHSMAFSWSIERDENRAEDGKYLRYLYSIERTESGLSSEEIEEYLSGPCSVMEFLVGLASRIENDIMYDADEEDRTWKWFWEMIENLGLDKFDDDHYSDVQVDAIVMRFLDRKYDEFGNGNIFKISKKAGPLSGPLSGPLLKNLEIWSQVHLWVNEK